MKKEKFNLIQLANLSLIENIFKAGTEWVFKNPRKIIDGDALCTIYRDAEYNRAFGNLPITTDELEDQGFYDLFPEKPKRDTFKTHVLEKNEKSTKRVHHKKKSK